MNFDHLKQILETIRDMPEEEVKHLHTDPKFTAIDVELYRRCKETGDFSQWEKLKKMRAMFSR